MGGTLPTKCRHIYAIRAPPHTFLTKSQILSTKKKYPHPQKTSKVAIFGPQECEKRLLTHFFGLHNIFFASPERIFEQKTPKTTKKRPTMVENGQKQGKLRKSNIFRAKSGVWHPKIGYPHSRNELQTGIFLAVGPNVNHYCVSEPRGVGKFGGMALM